MAAVRRSRRLEHPGPPGEGVPYGPRALEGGVHAACLALVDSVARGARARYPGGCPARRAFVRSSRPSDGANTHEVAVRRRAVCALGFWADRSDRAEVWVRRRAGSLGG